MWVTTQGGSWPWNSYYAGYPYNNRFCRLFEFDSIFVYRDRDHGGQIAMYVAGNYYRYGGQFDDQTNMHVVLTLSAGDYARLYVNGALAIVASYSLPAIPVPTYFNIGHSGGDSYSYLLGSVDEFRIWGGVLGAEEVLSNYFAGTGNLSIDSV